MLLMSWLFRTPGHQRQPPWYWQCRVNNLCLCCTISVLGNKTQWKLNIFVCFLNKFAMRKFSVHGGPYSFCQNTSRPTPGEGTPSVLGDMDVPPFWPPFLTFWGLNSIFLGYFFSSTNTKTIFWGIKTTNSHRIWSFWPQILFFPRSFWVQFSAASGTPPSVFGPSTPPGAYPSETALIRIIICESNLFVFICDIAPLEMWLSI